MTVFEQKEAFLAGEGNEWFRRNADVLGSKADHDQVLAGVRHLGIRPQSVIEIGCGNGWRLSHLREMLGAECYGIDPSQLAVDDAPEGVTLSVGTAEALPFETNSADLLIFGFCLYVTDPKDHFRIAAEADRVLKDGGVLCVLDFAPGRAYRNPYTHLESISSHKMDYANLFTRHPAYRLLHRVYGEHGPLSFKTDEAVCADFIRKDYSNAFPLIK